MLFVNHILYIKILWTLLDIIHITQVSHISIHATILNKNKRGT